MSNTTKAPEITRESILELLEEEKGQIEKHFKQRVLLGHNTLVGRDGSFVMVKEGKVLLTDHPLMASRYTPEHAEKGSKEIRNGHGQFKAINLRTALDKRIETLDNLIEWLVDPEGVIAAA